MRFSISAALAWLATAALIFGSSGAWAQNAPGAPLLVDRIVAVVNSEVITSAELAERVKMVTQQLSQQGTPLPAADLLQKQVLERMIMDRLQLQLAKETGLRVDDLQLDRTVERLAERNKMSLSQFRQTLERDGIRFDSSARKSATKYCCRGCASARLTTASSLPITRSTISSASKPRRRSGRPNST